MDEHSAVDQIKNIKRKHKKGENRVTGGYTWEVYSLSPSMQTQLGKPKSNWN